MRTPRFSDESGLAGKILVGVIAWALGAVLLLTNTLVAAQQIDTRVDRITHTVGPIDHDLDSVALAAETGTTARAILAAAQPLTGQADQIIQATTSIDASAKSINTTVGQIGDAVKGIDGSARSINGNVLEINRTVKDINGTAKAIAGTVNGIDGNVAGIGAAVKGIGANLAAVLGVAQEIRGDHAATGIVPGAGGLAAINRRADVIIGVVQGIKADTGNILVTVKSIETHAASINQKLPG